MMVTTPTQRSAPAWRRAYADAIRDPRELLDVLGLDPTLAVASPFPLRVPHAFVARMRRGDLTDPLLRQVLPLDAEAVDTAGFGRDPVAELDRSPVAGLITKYQGRVLWVLTGACAVHCRYCFRRHFPYQEHLGGVTGRREVVEYLRAKPSVREVILSGGDPLSLDDDVLAGLAHELATIPHLERLRVHTRLPIVLPDRVDDQLLAWLTGTRLTPVVVLHANHPAELDATVAAAVARLRGGGIVVLNQAVLLAGVNDNADTLAALSERLFLIGVVPYYLNQLDRVAGAAHFEVDDQRAIALVHELQVRLPGYLVPRLVRDDGASAFKVAVAP
jgi:EF-P beta-lysylation protein EpmB